MARTYIGIDIQPAGIALVAASGGVKEITVDETRYVHFPPQVSGDEAFLKALEEVTRQIPPAESVFLCAVPASAVSFRHVGLPFDAPKKIRMVLPSEIEPMLPFSLDTLVMDSAVVVKKSEENPSQIIAAAYAKSALDLTLEALKTLGIQPDVVVPGGWVLGHAAASGLQPSGTWLLVDVTGEQGVAVCGLGGQPMAIRAFRIPKRQEALSAQVFSEAERTVLGFSERLSLDLWPETVWVTGDRADQLSPDPSPFQGASQRLDLAHNTGTRVRIAPEAGWDPGTMNGALSLVLSWLKGGPGLHFHRGGMGFSTFFSENGRQLRKMAATCALIAVLGLFNLWYESHALGRRLSAIDRRINEVFTTTFPEIKRIVDPLQQMKVQIRELQEASGLASEGTTDTRVIDFIQVLSKEIPDTLDVQITQINFSGETVLLGGETDNFNTVDAIKTGLEKNTTISAVTISSANMEKSGEKVQFKLKVDLVAGP